MGAKIYKPAKNAMQSGKAKTKNWILEFRSENTRCVDELMGWTGNSDTKAQLKMKFETLDEAEKFAQSHNIDYIIITPKQPKLIKQAYADNFI